MISWDNLWLPPINLWNVPRREKMQVIDDFKCSQCGSEREIFHSNEAGEEYFCECGGRMVKQFSTGQSFRFYGGGTYVQHTKGD
jgi:predicted nucleic acid-binding Zn ribbon protein